MFSENKVNFYAFISSVYFFIAGVVAVVNYYYELSYSKWAYKHMPVWLAGFLVTISALGIVMGAFPVKKRLFPYRIHLYSIFVTAFLVIKPSFKLAPGYIKIIFKLSVIFFVVIKLALRKKGGN